MINRESTKEFTLEVAPQDRSDREDHSREADQREASWQPPSTLPDPSPRPDLVHRWVRTSAGGQSDPMNVSNSFREGWQPVVGSEYPELKVLSDPGTRWPDSIEVGGLLLCSAPASKMKARSAYYHSMTKQQMQSVTDQLEAEEDPRYRTMWREYQQSTSRGSGPRKGWPKQ